MAHETRTSYQASTHTRVLAAFFTSARNGVSVTDLFQSHRDFGTIIGFSSNKAFGSASGAWTLTFKKAVALGARSAVRDLWSDPEDVWVKIKVRVDGQVIDTVLGLIDSLGEATERVEGGKRIEVYTINGRDFGKILETTELWVNTLAQPSDAMRSIQAIADVFAKNIQGPPAHFVRILLEAWVGNNGAAAAQWMLPTGLGGGSFYEKLLGVDGRVRGIDSMTEAVNGATIAPQLFQIDQTGGKLWDSLQEYSNGAMNELYVDLRPEQTARPDYTNLLPTVTMRERQFPTANADNRTTSRSKWNLLRTHELDPGDVQRRAVAKGGASTRFNYWLIQPEGLGTDGFGIQGVLQSPIDGAQYGTPGSIPIWNNDSIAKHGLRRYMLTTRYISLERSEDDGVGSLIRLSAAWLKKVHDWYAPAPMQLSGTLETTRIFPEIRIGERVKERRAEGTITYYVEGVAHSYSYPGAGKTTLTVTRGEYDDEDLLAQVYNSYAHPEAGTAAELCFEPTGTGRDTSGDVETAADELIASLAAGCAYTAPDRTSVTEGKGFTVDGGGAGTRPLESERDGDDDLAQDPDAPVTTLDDTNPSVGDSSQIPSGNATGTDPSAPVLDQGRLDRNEPINIPAGDDDPIGGLNLTGTER